MPFDTLFRIANFAALVAWIALIALPRRAAWVRLALAAIVVGLCSIYTVLVCVYFFRVEGGGFGTLPAVQQLFTFPPVALAGWLHYLAFDLCIGCWVASRCDALGLSRWLQAPLLVTTFMFGPIGLLLAGGALAAMGWSPRRPEAA